MASLKWQVPSSATEASTASPVGQRDAALAASRVWSASLLLGLFGRGEPLDGIGQYFYPARFSTAPAPPGAKS
jgi:hypothetical protein